MRIGALRYTRLRLLLRCAGGEHCDLCLFQGARPTLRLLLLRLLLLVHGGFVHRFELQQVRKFSERHPSSRGDADWRSIDLRWVDAGRGEDRCLKIHHRR